MRRKTPMLWILAGIIAGIYGLAETKAIGNILIVPPRAYLAEALSVAAILVGTWLLARRKS